MILLLLRSRIYGGKKIWIATTWSIRVQPSGNNRELPINIELHVNGHRGYGFYKYISIFYLRIDFKLIWMSSCPITIFSHLSFDNISRRIVFVERDGDYLTNYMESLIRTVKSVDLLKQTICNTSEQIKQRCTILILYNCY